ncbi:hypothetical protein WJX74_000323 [Apatococcus lobatus]|uniref:DUF1772 domain-containing protein n=1 Tax=Apatococcus lobatus TaxID=904363 RepID=A0AAW1S963_9CHLO
MDADRSCISQTVKPKHPGCGLRYPTIDTTGSSGAMSERTELALGGLALVSSGLFAGFAAGITVSVYPAMMELDEKSALKYFSGFYTRAAVMQPLLLVTALAASGGALATCPLTSLSQKGHIVSAAASAFMLGWTRLTMVSENNEMVALGKKGQTSPKAGRMLDSWGTRHNVRTIVSVASFCVLGYAFLRRH